MCSPSSVDKESILPLPFIATDESFAFGCGEGQMDIVIPGLKQPQAAVLFAKRISAPGQKARTTLHKGSAAQCWQDSS